MEIAPNVIARQQSKIPEAAHTAGRRTVQGQLNKVSSSVSAPEAGREAPLAAAAPAPPQGGACAAEGFLELLPW